jgi:hypothetical protein
MNARLIAGVVQPAPAALAVTIMLPPRIGEPGRSFAMCAMNRVVAPPSGHISPI